MKRPFPASSREQSQRRGAAAVLMASLIPILVLFAAFSVNIAYIQLMRLEQKVAVDAATRAAATKLAQTDSQASAKAEARRVAQLHNVGSAAFDVDASNVVIGNATENAGGGYSFQANQSPMNAVRVLSNVGTANTSDPAAIPLLFNLTGNSTYSRSESSVASFLVNEVILCLDRSGSMKFDMSGNDWHYPTNNPKVPSSHRSYVVTSTGSTGFDENYYAAPHPTDSRWAVLNSAIGSFFDTAALAAVPPRVGLITWSSDSNNAGTTTTDYALPPYNINFNGNRGGISGQLTSRGNQTNSNGVFGSTWISDGLQAAITEYETGRSRRYSNKIIILLSDGVYQGADPYTKALVCRDRNIRIYSIALISGSAFTKLQEVATVTGGNAYMATNASQLATAFESIAKSLDTILVQ